MLRARVSSQLQAFVPCTMGAEGPAFLGLLGQMPLHVQRLPTKKQQSPLKTAMQHPCLLTPGSREGEPCPPNTPKGSLAIRVSPGLRFHCRWRCLTQTPSLCTYLQLGKNSSHGYPTDRRANQLQLLQKAARATSVQHILCFVKSGHARATRHSEKTQPSKANK